MKACSLNDLCPSVGSRLGRVGLGLVVELLHVCITGIVSFAPSRLHCSAGRGHSRDWHRLRDGLRPAAREVITCHDECSPRRHHIAWYPARLRSRSRRGAEARTPHQFQRTRFGRDFSGALAPAFVLAFLRRSRIGAGACTPARSGALVYVLQTTVLRI